MDITQKAVDTCKTWNYHNGYYSNIEAMRKNIQLNWFNKKQIRDLFLNGQDKISFFVNGSSEFDEVEAINQIQKYIEKQVSEKRTFWKTWEALSKQPTSEWKFIINNVVTNRTVDFLTGIFLHRAKSIMDNLEYLKIEKARLLHFPSPKLTKQVIQLGEFWNIPQEITEEILSVFSIIQNFKIKQTAREKITISVDPLDFITCSVNDYGWSSCAAPDGSYAGGPISLMVDKYTAVAFIESTTSELILYNDGDKTVTGSNKKTRRLIHFTDNFKGVLLNKSYPIPNIALEKGIVNFFSSFGFQVYDELDKRILDNIELTNYAIYNDIQSNSVTFCGNVEDYIYIGDVYYCVECGELVDPEDNCGGLCCNCIAKYENLECEEENEEDY